MPKEPEFPDDIELVKCAVCGHEDLISASGKYYEGCRMLFNNKGQAVCDFCTSPSDPSEPSKDYWLFASRQRGKYPLQTENGGKWLIFANNKDVDALWSKIKKATESGTLGGESKVSTPKPKPTNIGYKKGEHVICVYTYDANDEKDVKRIREQLRTLGIIERIPYKLDNDPRYSATGDKNISRYYE